MPDRGCYHIEVRESAAKEIRSLSSDVRTRVTQAISALRTVPRPRGVVKLKGSKSLFRMRVGVYRVIYDIDDTTSVIVITRVRHRREAYD